MPVDFDAISAQGPEETQDKVKEDPIWKRIQKFMHNCDEFAKILFYKWSCEAECVL